jgi:hypothetical protein
MLEQWHLVYNQTSFAVHDCYASGVCSWYSHVFRNDSTFSCIFRWIVCTCVMANPEDISFWIYFIFYIPSTFIVDFKGGGEVDAISSQFYHHHHRHHWQNNPSWAIVLLGRFFQVCSGSQFFGCLAYKPPTWRTRSLFLCPPMAGWSSYTPRDRDHFTVLRWRYTNPPAHGVFTVSPVPNVGVFL